MVDNCGNPLLRDWVKEWMETSQGLQSKAYFTYKKVYSYKKASRDDRDLTDKNKAYTSLCKCPVSFSHPSEAIALDGIGPGLVKKFEESMKNYCKENGLPMPPKPGRATKKRNAQAAAENADGIELDEDGMHVPFQPKPKKNKPYVPGFRTGGYAILLALLDIHNVGRQSATKEQICRLAQPHCDASLTLAEPGKNYTAFNSMKTLCDKDYVYKNGRPAKFQLTSTGVEMAEKLREVNESRGGQPAASGSSSSSGGARRVGASSSGGSSAAVIAAAAAGGVFSSGAAFAAAIGDDSDDDLDGTDIGLYVLNPSQHQSISINGQSSSNGSRNPSTARSSSARNRRNTQDLIPDKHLFSDLTPSSSTSANRTLASTADILAALAEESPAPKRQKNYNRNSKAKSRSATSAYLDSLLEQMDNENPNELDMSMYVLNPSEHQSISLNGRTVTNNNTTVNNNRSNSATTIPKRPNTPSNPNDSSVTNSHLSSFAKRVMDADDNNEFEDLHMNNRPSTSKYRTPPTSSILQADSKKKVAASNKRKFNVDDYQVDLTPSSLPTFNNSGSSNTINEDIVNLLSSPESSPALRPTSASLTQEEEKFLFEDDFDPDKDYFPLSQSRTKRITNETFHFTYLDTENKPVRHASQAAILIDEASSSLMYLVKFYTKQARHPKVQQIVKQSMEGEFTTGYLPETHVVNTCPGLPATPVLPLHREEDDSFWPAQQQPLSQTISQASPLPASQPLSTSSSQLQDLTSQPFFPTQPSTTTNYTELIEQQGPMECLLPGEYEIALVLDSREIQMKGNRDYFQDSLAAKGIQCITRSIDLGDVIWIARKKTNNSSSSASNQTEELFLDYIIERKRLDDLVSSIKDGRFTEQKTRLKRSGAEKVIYVVEEYNREEAERFGAQAIQTAMSSIQIIDGIYLKRTNSIDETIDYLVSATKLIERIYANTTLYSIPGHIITRQNYLELKAAYKRRATPTKKEAFLVSYSLFGQLNTKNGSTSLHEVYLRMLMTIKGCNAERALSLIKIYPTPRALLNAFKGKSLEEAKNLAKDATQGHINRRRWGPQLSEKLYNIWGALEYPASANGDSDSDD